MQHDAYIAMAETEQAHWWFQGRRRVLAAVIAGLNLPPDARILELGSGTGGNFAMLGRFGRLTAMEENALARVLSVRKSWGAVAVLAGALPDDLPVFAEKFDLVCLFDVLEHVAEDVRALAAARGLLAPGGRAVITVPAYRRLWSAHDARMQHQRRYGRAELQAKLGQAGFRVLKLSHANMLLFPAALLVRLAGRVLPAANRAERPLPGFLNACLAAVFGAERFLLARADLPFGLSLLAVAASASDPT